MHECAGLTIASYGSILKSPTVTSFIWFAVAPPQGGVKDIAEARDRRADIQAAIRDNDRELARFKVGRAGVAG